MMTNVVRFWAARFSLSLAVTGFLFAQEWKTATALPGVDFSKLSVAQKATALRILRSQGCSCGCSMRLAECRVVDPNCSYSKGMVAAVVEALAQGKSADEAQAAAVASHWGHVEEPKLLDDPVKIPVANAPTLGPSTAPITIVEFSDFQCPYCAAATPEIESLLKAYPSEIKLIFKEYPLEFHPQASLAAAAAVAAGKQGKFWQMHDALFQNHDDLSRKNILALAGQNGLDVKQFQTDLDSTEVRESIIRDVQDGDHANVEGTPTLFINGQRYNGAITVSRLKPVLDSQLKPVVHAASATQN